MVRKSLCAAIIACWMVMAYGTASARVKGVCQYCHTMHNSQGGQPMAKTPGVAYWSGSSINTADANVSAANEHLLRTDCIGCHSSTDNTTVVTFAGNHVPIVHNMQAPAYRGSGSTNALAGGNFFWSDTTNNGAGSNMLNGHNVTQANTRLSVAPGLNSGGSMCLPSCHYTLYRPLDIDFTTKLTGCQGCHYQQFHHKEKGPGAHQDPTYRFLIGPSGNGMGGYYVQGIEDPGFEQSPNATVHNVYMANGASKAGVFAAAPTGMVNGNNCGLSAFCAACHGAFHEDTKDSSGVWIRHPIDVLVGKLVDDGHENESFFYNGPNGYGVNTYDPAVPVAFNIANPYTDPVSSYGTVDDTRGKVTCVSCHRTHASPYPQMLRFAYNMIIAGNSATAGGDGCFACHTEKSLQ